MCAKYASLKDRLLAAEASIRGLDAVKDKYLPLEQDGVIYNLYNLPDGFVIKGNVDLMFKGLTKLPDLSKVIVKGYFTCGSNQLTTLEGAPQKVGSGFYCHYNHLTTLEGAPKEVGGEFYCPENKLTSLKGVPQKIEGSFNCSENQLTSLEGAPQKVGGNFNCSGNQLTSLKGAPQKVGGNFNCSYNQLTSLKGVPQKIEGNFYCSDNQLTSLEGAPEEISGDFHYEYNQLTTWEGAPRVVGGAIWCYGNQLTSLFGISQMKDENNIYSDQEVCGKYDLSASGFTYEELLNTSRYKSEAAHRKISAAQHQTEDVTPKKAKTELKIEADAQTEIVRAKFQEWLKNKESEKK
ncbi:MAG: hypothetical protein IJ770_03205 [Alphaproteobacteria bacterium]|nr:hypothetical protein [Alphaproteobacteria bacterium]